MKYEQLYIPKPHRDPLSWRLAHMACLAFFCFLVLSFAIGFMWSLAFIKDTGGIPSLFEDKYEAHFTTHH